VPKGSKTALKNHPAISVNEKLSYRIKSWSAWTQMDAIGTPEYWLP